MTTLQIARAKEQFLEDALRVIAPVVNNGGEVISLPEDVESLARDAIDLFATLLRCDEQHHLLAVTSEDYPYLTAEEELAALLRRFLAMCEELCMLGETLQRRGHEIKSQSALEAVCAHAQRLVHDDQTFYETETYRTLAERAQTEYQSGQVEEWPG
jgi:hypothetical protein